MTTIADCISLALPSELGECGALTSIEGALAGGGTLPFEIRRLYYLYDVPADSVRGGHAHFSLQQYVIALAGSFDMIMDDGHQRKRFRLNDARQATYVPPMVWHELENFSPGSICLVLASDVYDESDYLRDYADFLRAVERLERAPSQGLVAIPPLDVLVPA